MRQFEEASAHAASDYPNAFFRHSQAQIESCYISLTEFIFIIENIRHEFPAHQNRQRAITANYSGAMPVCTVTTTKAPERVSPHLFRVMNIEYDAPTVDILNGSNFTFKLPAVKKLRLFRHPWNYSSLEYSHRWDFSGLENLTLIEINFFAFFNSVPIKDL